MCNKILLLILLFFIWYVFLLLKQVLFDYVKHGLDLAEDQHTMLTDCGSGSCSGG